VTIGRTFGDYLRFATGTVALVVVVGMARLALSMAGVPVAAARFVSVTTMALMLVTKLTTRTTTQTTRTAA
jgi:hypothetical protein